MRGGPITFALSGSLQMGETLQSFSHNNTEGTGPTLDSSAQNTASSGVLLQVSRRTASTTLQLSMPAGLSTRNTSVGEAQLGYYTPLYGLIYGGEQLGLLGGAPLGQILRGYSLVLPLRSGELAFYHGNAPGSNEATLFVNGLRARTIFHNALLEFGLDRINDRSGGSAYDVLFGSASQSAGGLIDQTFEGALQHDAGRPGFAANGTAYDYRFNYGGTAGYASFELRHIANGFLTAGAGGIFGDNAVTGSWHAGKGATQYGLSESVERTDNAGTLETQRLGTFTLSHQLRSGSDFLLTLSDQHMLTAGSGPQWLGQAQLQAATSIFGTQALFGLQMSRTTASFESPLAQVGYSGQLQRFMGRATLTAGYQWMRQLGGGTFADNGLGTLGVTWPLQQRTNLTLSANMMRRISPSSDAVQLMPLLTVQHYFSPALALSVSYGRQSLRDKLNPSSDGSSRVIQIQLTAPFALGSGLITGRIDPKLPAAIVGSVLQDETGAMNGNSSIPAGVGNVQVVLDNTQVQRTDLSGHFQFNFVSPGQHTVRLESASLPRGVTADQPYASIEVQGGQTGQVNFRIGVYGAIEGHLYGILPDGSKFPVANAEVVVDKTQRAYTDQFGAYGVGRLTAGKHEVAVDQSTLPANVSFGDQGEQTAVVSNGIITQVNFTGVTLGSIAGTITYDPLLAPQYVGGVDNAYVVAEPGEHASITNPDGTYLIDNLPPGTYTLNVDPETLPLGTTAVGGPFTEVLGPGGHIESVNFTVQKQAKNIVFTFHGGNAVVPPSAQLHLLVSTLPPGGATTVEFHAAPHAQRATISVFGRVADLTFDAKAHLWRGVITVPVGTKNGKYTARAQLVGSVPLQAQQSITVDNTIPLATFVLMPANPQIGQYVSVRAHFLADVHEGDEIHWLDGQITKLSHRLAGRVFEFTVKISEHPMTGLLLSGGSRLPITLR